MFLHLRYFLTFVMLCVMGIATAQYNDDGYDLWLNYGPVTDKGERRQVQKLFSVIDIPDSPYAEAMKYELTLAAQRMTGIEPTFDSNSAQLLFSLVPSASIPADGFEIRRRNGRILVEASTHSGLLYGMYRLLREVQMGRKVKHISDSPQCPLRIINHWDNLDGSIERGYAGQSIWQWDDLPEKLSPRYRDYARALASVGINAIVLNNVNADSHILSQDYLEKVVALYHVFMDYGITVYLSVNFGAPLPPAVNGDIRSGGIGPLPTANPRDSRVVEWWRNKISDIYRLMPCFGGFLVKANSEGMPGPQTYGLTHADGANMFARLLKPYGGRVMWRTFVYDENVDPDRIKRSYKEFMPLDGKFDDNVMLQTKNGPLDFQPIEPLHPLFGAMQHTTMLPELQITQEYTGQSVYLVYLAEQWQSLLLQMRSYPAIAGVANVGGDRNWTRHPFAQANWYAFARLAWNATEPIDNITNEWIRCTFHCNDNALAVIRQMMMGSWKDYAMSHTPYSIGMTVAVHDHFTADFPYRCGRYWQMDSEGIGYDRTSRGTDYVSQYPEPLRSLYDDIDTCPELYLLCFHKAPWNHRMRSGLTLREELPLQLRRGVDRAECNIRLWQSIKDDVPAQQYNTVIRMLNEEHTAATAFMKQAEEHLLP